MKRTLICLVMGFCFLIPAAVFAENYVSAMIVTDSGVITTEKLLVEDDQFKSGIRMDVIVNGVKTSSKIPLALVDRIIISGSKTSGNGKYQFLKGTLVLKKGKRIGFERFASYNLFGFNRLSYKNPDPITGKPSRQSHSFHHVKTIELKAVNGPFMVDSKGRFFPPDYQFSPYTGEKLVPQRQ